LYTIAVQAINSIKWAPDSKLLATGATDGNLRIWSIRQNQNINTIPYKDEIKDLSWSPDSQQFAFGGWGISDDVLVKVWSLADGKTTVTFPHKDNINTITWSPNGNYIASGTHDGVVWIWQAK
jgi:WD40 repeat protein